MNNEEIPLPGNYIPGAICIIDEGDSYGVVKILAIDADEAHVRMYSNKYHGFPDHLDTGSLTMKTIEGGGFGIGHVPLEREGFNNWKPVVVAVEPLTEEELEGYHIWKGE